MENAANGEGSGFSLDMVFGKSKVCLRGEFGLRLREVAKSNVCLRFGGSKIVERRSLYVELNGFDRGVEWLGLKCVCCDREDREEVEENGFDEGVGANGFDEGVGANGFDEGVGAKGLDGG